MSVLRCPARPAVSGSSVWGTHASSSLAQSGANRVLIEGRNRNRWSFAPLWVHVAGTEWDFDRSSAERSTPTSAECFARGFVSGRPGVSAGRGGSRPRLGPWLLRAVAPTSPPLTSVWPPPRPLLLWPRLLGPAHLPAEPFPQRGGGGAGPALSRGNNRGRSRFLKNTHKWLAWLEPA